MPGIEWLLEGWLQAALGILGLLVATACPAAAGEARQEGGRA